MTMLRTGDSTVDSRYAWCVAFVSFFVMSFGGGVNYIIVVTLKPIAAEFDWPRAVPALCYSLALLGMGIGGIFMGSLSDRIGVARLAAMGVVMLSLGTFWAAHSDSRWELYVAHGLLIGLLGNATLFAPLLANATRWFERRRGIAIAIVASGQTIGAAIWPPIYRYLVDGYGWRQAFLVFSVAVIVLALPFTYVLRGRPPRADTGTAAQRSRSNAGMSRLGIAPGVVTGLLSIAIVGCCVAMSMPSVHLISYATDLGFSTVRAAEMLALLAGCAVLSRLMWGMVADRTGGLLALLVGSSCQALCLTAFCLIEAMPSFYVVAALFGLAYGGIVPCYALVIREYLPAENLGLHIGIVLLFGTVGMALGGWLGAAIFDAYGSYRAGFMLGVGFNALNLAVVGWLVCKSKRPGIGGVAAPA